MARLRAWLPPLLLFVPLGVYLLALVPRLIWRDAEGLWVGQEHLWSDWPLHIAMLRRFADCPPSEWLAQHPMIGGTPLRYPFAAALLSGLLVRAGASVEQAIVVPTLVFFALLLAGMYRLWARLLGDSGRASLAVWLFFLSAGPGALGWFADLRAVGIDALLAPPREYGRVDEYSWYAGNFLVGMLLPQRAFLPGMTLTVWALLALEAARDEGSARRRRVLLGLAGLAAGILPLVHVHSLLALAAFGAARALGAASRRTDLLGEALLLTVSPALVLGGSAYLLFLRPETPYPGFVSWHPWFVAPEPRAWPAMWLRLWGLSLPAAAVGTLWLRARAGSAGLAGGAWLLFAAGNLVLFQPVPWDNSKVFLWAYFGLCGALAEAVARLWERGGALRPLALALAGALCLTGVAELVALQRIDRHRWMVLTAQELRLGDAIRARTRPSALFLTNMDTSNAPMVWGARPIYLGFGGWMANFGFDHAARERALRRMFAGGAEAEILLRREGIRYVQIGPAERSAFRPDEGWYAARFPVFWRDADRVVYTVEADP